MASRKRKPDSPQIGLTFACPSLPVVVPTSPEPIPIAPSSLLEQPADLDLNTFDDYDDSITHNDVPRLSLVDSPRKVSIIVEAVGERFEVSRLRDSGTTVACIFYTREELEEFIERAQAALEI